MDSVVGEVSQKDVLLAMGGRLGCTSMGIEDAHGRRLGPLNQ
jgi:hypothetical protein